YSSGTVASILVAVAPIIESANDLVPFRRVTRTSSARKSRPRIVSTWPGWACSRGLQSLTTGPAGSGIVGAPDTRVGVLAPRAPAAVWAAAGSASKVSAAAISALRQVAGRGIFGLGGLRHRQH